MTASFSADPLRSAPFQAAMAEATRLTRAGDLKGATALIQHALNGQPTADWPEASQGPLLEAAAPTAAPTAGKPFAAAGWSPPQVARRRRPVPLDVPQGARWLAGSYENPFGSRDYRLYVPSRHAGGKVPLVVMLHGCTQDPEDFARGTGMNRLAEETGFLVAYPAQSGAANPSRCWNWFQPTDQERARGEPSLVAGITSKIIAEHHLDPARVYVAGLSAGGATAAILAATYPDLYAASGVHSGLPKGAARDVASAFAAMRQPIQGDLPRPGGRLVPTIVFHGEADRTVAAANGRTIVRHALEAGPPARPVIEVLKVPGGHGYTRTRHVAADGRCLIEHWAVDGLGHAWSGGHAAGSYTDPKGPDASRAMLRFFLDHERASPA